MFNRESWLSVIPFLAVCFAAGGLGAIATNRSAQIWYPHLRKPEWNPPNWVFAPVWTFLYTLMALSAWLIWRQGSWREVGGGADLILDSVGAQLRVVVHFL